MRNVFLLKSIHLSCFLKKNGVSQICPWGKRAYTCLFKYEILKVKENILGYYMMTIWKCGGENLRLLTANKHFAGNTQRSIYSALINFSVQCPVFSNSKIWWNTCCEIFYRNFYEFIGWIVLKSVKIFF